MVPSTVADDTSGLNWSSVTWLRKFWDRPLPAGLELDWCDRSLRLAQVEAGEVACAPMAPHRFPIRVGRRSRPVLRLFGVRPDNAYVDLDGDLDARFGFYRVSTSVSNLASWRIEGPWPWITAIGVRTSLRHRDVTFGGSHRGGVRVDFNEPVRFGFLRIPALYVTVEDLEGFGAALAERGIRGEDARKRRVR